MDAKETTLYAAILITSLTIGIIFIYFIISIIRQQRRSLALYKRSVQAEIRTLEKERGRMAADLHDELGPFVSAIKFQMGSLEVSPEDSITVEKMYTYIDGLIERMRVISNNLMPVVLVRKGLAAAIDEFIYSLPATLECKIIFNHTNIAVPGPEQALHLYRITTEIIHNTLKHAGATRLQISLESNSRQICLRSEDNGCGFNYAQINQRPAGNGLHNLLSRAELLDGQLFVESVPGKGTIFQLEIPIKSTLHE